jgi:hypothetical protein
MVIIYYQEHLCFNTMLSSDEEVCFKGFPFVTGIAIQPT